MIDGADTTIFLPLTGAELRTLADLMRQRHLFLVGQPRPADKWDESVDPSWMDTLDVTVNGRHGRWVWQEPKLRPGAPEEWQRLFAISDSIYSLVTRKAEYRRLPRAHGAYL